jgi:hypothetical protein
MYRMKQLLLLYMNYDTTILFSQEYNRGLVHLNLFEPQVRVIRSIIIGVAGLPIHRYGGLFFISCSMTLSRILRRYELQSKDVMSKLVTLT